MRGRDIPRHQIQLGSGLDPTKLADTIGELPEANDGTTSLICNVAGESHSWVHLNSRGTHWRLTAGYPHADPPRHILPALPESMTAGWIVTMYIPHVYLALEYDGIPDSGTLAELIIGVMRHIQGLQQDAIVEIVMEYDK